LNCSIKVNEKTKFGLAWKIQDLQELYDFIRKLAVEISTLMDKLQSQTVQDNFARKLGFVKQQLLYAVQRISKHQ